MKTTTQAKKKPILSDRVLTLYSVMRDVSNASAGSVHIVYENPIATPSKKKATEGEHQVAVAAG